jgi:hypothetical protein
MQVNVISAHDPFKNPNVQRVTNLTNDVTTAQLDITLQNLVTILGYPNKVNLEIVHTMTTFAVFHYELTFTQKYEIFVEAKALH